MPLPAPAARVLGEALRRLAAGVHAGAGVIVTFNLRDFQADALRPHGVSVVKPDAFVARRFDADPAAVRLAAECPGDNRAARIVFYAQ